jgi:hypothetical protein
MSKIVELLIDWENMEFDDLGVDIMSLVEKPAIQIGWQAFSEEEMNEFQAKVLELCRQKEFGEVYDPEKIKIIDLSKEEFADVQEVLEGLAVLDELGNLVPETQGEIRYRYTGRLKANTRLFCASMIGLNKMYTADELVLMGNIARGISNSLYPQASRIGENGEVIGGIGEWMGGPNCGHYWQKLEVFPNGIVNDLGRAQGAMGRTMSSLPNDGYRMSWSFSKDDEMIITGPAMIPDSLIARKDKLGNTFHVYFSKDTIKKIAKKFLEDNNAHNTDINHNEDIVKENTLLETWIVEDTVKDKSNLLGYELPVGSWMVSYKINNKETWQKIKNGELNGYSVTGQFIEKLQS